MTLLSRYVARRFAVPFAVALGVVVFVLVLERLLEITRLLADAGASGWRAVEIIGYLMPHYLGLGLPAATFLGVLLAFRQLRQDSELAVLHAAGVPLLRLLRPVIVLALLLAAVVAANAGVLQPHARHAYRAALSDISASPLNFALHPGVFHDLGGGMVLRADAVERGGARLTGVFAADRRSDGGRVLAVAQGGRVARDAGGAGLILELRDGSLIRQTPGAPIRRIGFDSYVWQLPLPAPQGHGPRGQDERELTVVELVRDAGTLLPARISAAQVAAELHARLIAPVSVPLLALLAAALAGLGGAGRSERAVVLVAGLAALVLYQKLLAFGEAMVAQGQASPLLVQWGVVLAFAAATGVLLHRANLGPGRRGGRAPAFQTRHPAGAGGA